MDTSITHIRPRFKITVPHPPIEIMDRIKAQLEHTPEHMSGFIVDHHVTLDIVGDVVHYWSPQLNFRIEEAEEEKSHAVISGLIGPKPAVWTMFMFVYFSVGIIGFFISSYGVSKLLLGEYSNFILAFPAAILFMFTAYKAGKYGEQLGKDQIEMLKQFVREAIFYED